MERISTGRVSLLLGLALACTFPAHAQQAAIVVDRPDTVVVRDPDPATPGIQQTTTTTTTEHIASVTHAPAHVVHHPAYRRPVHHAAVSHATTATAHTHSVHSVDTRTTTQTTLTVPPHDSSTVVSENADGSVTVTSDQPPSGDVMEKVEVQR